jgi:hypothetical protein
MSTEGFEEVCIRIGGRCCYYTHKIYSRPIIHPSLGEDIPQGDLTTPHITVPIRVYGAAAIMSTTYRHFKADFPTRPPGSSAGISTVSPLEQLPCSAPSRPLAAARRVRFAGALGTHGVPRPCPPAPPCQRGGDRWWRTHKRGRRCHLASVMRVPSDNTAPHRSDS